MRLPILPPWEGGLAPPLHAGAGRTEELVRHALRSMPSHFGRADGHPTDSGVHVRQQRAEAPSRPRAVLHRLG